MPIPRPQTGVDPFKVYDPTAEKQAFTPIVHPKSGLERGTLVNVLKDHYLFKHLVDREMDVIISYMEGPPPIPISYQALKEGVNLLLPLKGPNSITV